MQYNEEFQSLFFYCQGCSQIFCFDRLALTGKLIRMCPLIYVALYLSSSMYRVFNNLVTRLEHNFGKLFYLSICS